MYQSFKQHVWLKKVEIYNIFNANPSPSHQSDITPNYKNQLNAIQGRNAPSRLYTTAGEYKQFLFNTAYSPLSPLKGAAIVQSMQKIVQTCACIFTFHKGTVHNSLQKAGLFSRCMIFSKKDTCSRYSLFFNKCISKVSVALSCTKCIVSLQVCYCFSTRQRF